jgi:hypothetical protein
MHVVTDNVPARRRGSTHPDRPPDGQLSFDGRPLRFHGSAGHPAAARCARLSADAVRPDAHFIFRRPNDHRLGSGIVMEPDQYRRVQGDAAQRLAGNWILPVTRRTT